jgi:hypothetical protein
MPIGSLIIGLVASKTGLAPSLAVCAGICALCTLMVMRLRSRIREHAHPILVRSGALSNE